MDERLRERANSLRRQRERRPLRAGERWELAVLEVMEVVDDLIHNQEEATTEGEARGEVLRDMDERLAAIVKELS